MASDCTFFAWQGLQIDVPRDWELGSVSGGAKKGYMRLDDSDMPRFEATWEDGPLTGPVSSVSDRYLKKAKIEGQVKRDVRLTQIDGADTEFFITHGATDAMHMAWRCRACGRVLLARVLYRRDESMRSISARVLGSLRDHAAGGRMPWALFGLRMHTPERYELVNYTVQAGRVDLSFAAGKSLMRAVRLSLAETLLKRMKLRDWYAADEIGKWPTCKVDVTDGKRGEHDSLTAQGPERSLIRRVFFGRRAARGTAWHCPQGNAIFAAQWLGREKDLAEWEAFAASFACHDSPA